LCTGPSRKRLNSFSQVMGFSAIIGHEKQKKILLSFLERGKLPQAFLFSGQAGIGKKRLAYELARYILCEHGNGCGQCRSCVNVGRGVHPDVLAVVEETSVGIEKSRMISREVCEHPYEGKKRIIIIDGAETMTTEAANALLKTLEEPPPFNLFILITASERGVPLTIRSRCVRLPFSPLEKEDLREYFLRVPGVEEERAALLAQIAYGSIGCGLFWAEEENFLLRRRLAELVTGKNRSFLHATLLSEKVTQREDHLFLYLSFLLSLFRDLYVEGQMKDGALVVNRDLRDLLRREMVDLKWIEESIRKIQETMRVLRYNVNRWLTFENLLISIMR
jgi:DNA polymerase III subunit delta'